MEHIKLLMSTDNHTDKIDPFLTILKVVLFSTASQLKPCMLPDIPLEVTQQINSGIITDGNQVPNVLGIWPPANPSISGRAITDEGQDRYLMIDTLSLESLGH